MNMMVDVAPQKESHWFKRKLRNALRRLAGKLGAQHYTLTSTWADDQEFREIRSWAKANGIYGIPDDRCFLLLRAAQAVSGVPGDLIEMGCRAGLSSSYLLAGTAAAPEKQLLAFDSFQGLSAPSPEDIAESGRAAWRQGALAVGEEIFLRNTRRFGERARSYKGWIPERFDEVSDRTFCLVHIDVDLYQPTIDSLVFAYPRTAPGGMIICDDYGSRRCPGARKAVDDFFSDKPEPLLELPSSQSIVIKQ